MLGGDVSFPEAIQISVMVVNDWESLGADHAGLESRGL